MTTATKPKVFPLTDGAYKFLTNLAQYWLPAAATFYVALAVLWDFPNVEQIVGTITAADILLGTLLGISKKSYNASDAPYDGVITVVDKDGEATLQRLEVTVPLEGLHDKGSVTLKFQDAASQ